ncbi:MAG: nucleotide sugar dehydrogenase [Clostridia bacterium]|nr:nucleotide sugar dehydrogenase [Clostridia bacterium]
MKIAIVGAGYVGLSNAVILAQNNDVFLVDIVKEKINLINKKISPFFDNDIQHYLSNVSLNLIATADANYAYEEAEIVIIAVSTNYDSNNNCFDISNVETIIKNALSVNPKINIFIKSTVPVGFTERMRKKFNYEFIFFSPEFLREGKALYDNLYPSRIVVGVPEKKSKYLKKAQIFINLLKKGAKKKKIKTFFTGLSEAESIKLFSNTYLALRVAFFNELDTYAQTKKLCSSEIISAVCADPRIGNFYNNPSFGYGGYCLPKDTKQLMNNFKDVPENLISSIVKSNKTRADFISKNIFDRIENIKSNESRIVVGVYRLTMKNDSDDFRESSIQNIIKSMSSFDCDIVIYEPLFKETTFLGHMVTHDLMKFKKISHIIIANRIDFSLEDVKEKIYTRDVFKRD